MLRSGREHVELVVPDLTPPARAAVAADGMVACVTCSARLPVGEADVVGLGYRCTACTDAARLRGWKRRLVVPPER